MEELAMPSVDWRAVLYDLLPVFMALALVSVVTVAGLRKAFRFTDAFEQERPLPEPPIRPGPDWTPPVRSERLLP